MNKSKLIEDAIQTAVQRGEIAGCCLSVIDENGEGIRVQAGEARREDHVPFKRNTIVRLYSLTKVVTAVAVLHLLEQGRLDLYDPVSYYLPAFSEQRVCCHDGTEPLTRPILIRDLMNMTSGLVYPGTENKAQLAVKNLYNDVLARLHTNKPVTLQDFAARLAQCPLAFQPGSSWQYGTSADVAGAVIERITGQSLRDFMRQQIFIPLGMEDTDFIVPAEKKYRLAEAYECSDNGCTPKLYTGENLAIRRDGGENPYFSGGAGLFSTMEDMEKFAKMLLQNGKGSRAEILQAGTVKFLESGIMDPQCMSPLSTWIGLEGYSYSNFVRILKEPGRNGSIGETGEYGWDGWLGAYLSISPQSKRAMLLMMQRTDYGTGHLTRKLRNIIFC